MQKYNIISSGTEKCECGRTVKSIYINKGRFTGEGELDMFVGRCRCGEIFLRIAGDWDTNIIEKSWKKNGAIHIKYIPEPKEDK